MLVVFPTAGGVTQMRVEVPCEATVAEATSLVSERCPAGTPRDLMGLCVNPTRSYPEEFRNSSSFPFFDENEKIEDCLDLIRISAMLYWKPISGIKRDREHAMDQSKGLPSIQIKIVFPPTFPTVSKMFRLDYDRTVQQVVIDVAAAMHFKASMVTMIGLRIPQKLLDTPEISAVVDALHLRSEPSFPFLESSRTVRHYRKLLILLEYLDYRYPSSEEVEVEEASVALQVVSPEERLVDAIMWKTPDKEGFLNKQGHRVRSWKNRYFMLQADMLFYFVSRPENSSVMPLGSICLRGAVISTMLKEASSGKVSLKAVFVFPPSSFFCLLQCSALLELFEMLLQAKSLLRHRLLEQLSRFFFLSLFLFLQLKKRLEPSAVFVDVDKQLSGTVPGSID
jgi:hypothetical protein